MWSSTWRAISRRGVPAPGSTTPWPPRCGSVTPGPATPRDFRAPPLFQCENQAPAPGASLLVQDHRIGGGTHQRGGSGGAERHRHRRHHQGLPHRLSGRTGLPPGFECELRPSHPGAQPGDRAGGHRGEGPDSVTSSGTPAIAVDVAGWFTDDSDASALGDLFTPAITPTPGLRHPWRARATPPRALARPWGHSGRPWAVTVSGTDAIPPVVSAVVPQRDRHRHHRRESP